MVSESAIPLDEVSTIFMENSEFREEQEKSTLRVELTRQIISARCKKGMTQEELAERVGMKRSAISRIESGKTNPTYDTLSKISRALNCRFIV